MKVYHLWDIFLGFKNFQIPWSQMGFTIQGQPNAAM